MKYILIIFILVSSCSSDKEAVHLRRIQNQVNLQEIPFNKGSFLNLTLPIKVQHSELNCMLGDYDAITELQKILNTDQIAMTVEPLFTTSKKPIFHNNFKYSKYIYDLEGTFANQLLITPGVYGVFVCTDKDEDGSCGENKLDDINDLIHQVFSIKKNTDSKIKKDRPVFFKPIFVTMQSIFIPIDFENNKKMMTEVMRNVFEYSPEQANFTYKEIMRYQTKLSNVPLKEEGKRLLVDLPLAGQICDRKALRKMQQNRRIDLENNN